MLCGDKLDNPPYFYPVALIPYTLFCSNLFVYHNIQRLLELCKAGAVSFAASAIPVEWQPSEAFGVRS